MFTILYLYAYTTFPIIGYMRLFEINKYLTNVVYILCFIQKVSTKVQMRLPLTFFDRLTRHMANDSP